jgi:phosphoribosyl 1,2-cyclic phosphodiesterase
MSLSICVLGSGSKGNCTLLSATNNHADTHVLIDCGFSPRETRRRLGTLGLTMQDINAVVLTHLDTDHCHAGWAKTLRNHDIDVHLHTRHRNTALRRDVPGRVMNLFTESFAINDAIDVQPVLLSHDQLGTVGYVFEHHGARLGFATDLGRVPDSLIDAFAAVDALALESNYDRQLQVGSNRPDFLKRRIMGGAGHLSNDESFAAVRAIARRTHLQHIVTLHLSQQCNTPRHVQQVYAKQEPGLLDVLTISSQTQPSPILHIACNGNGRAPAPRAGQQLAMFG